jgi:hypothetical protein
MSVRSIFLIFFLIIPNTIFAQAAGAKGGLGTLLEPFMGMNSQTISGDGVEDGAIKTTMFGTRLGIHYDSYQFGLDYRAMSGSYVVTEFGRTYEYSQSAISLFIGYVTPYYFRPYFVLVTSTSSNIVPSDTRREIRGGGKLFGLSLYFEAISINLEFGSYSWKTSEERGVRTELTDAKSSVFALSLSFPLDF